jgi:hypothetical protein
MIRWCIGFFLVLGSVGGLEQDTMTISQTLAFATLGFVLIGWATSDFNKQYGEDV